MIVVASGVMIASLSRDWQTDMKSKGSANSPKAERDQSLKKNKLSARGGSPRGPRPLRNVDILAGTKLSLATLKQVLQCYAEFKLPGETAAQTGLSQVTVYKIFDMIRSRLYFSGIYLDVDMLIYSENFELDTEDFPGLGYNSDLMIKTARQYLQDRKHVREYNKSLYICEAIFRYEIRDWRRRVTERFLDLITATIRSTGPINRKPERWSAAEFYYVTNRNGLYRQRALDALVKSFTFNPSQRNYAALRYEALYGDPGIVYAAHDRETNFDPSRAPGANGVMPPGKTWIVTPVPEVSERVIPNPEKEAKRQAESRARLWAWKAAKDAAEAAAKQPDQGAGQGPPEPDSQTE